MDSSLLLANLTLPPHHFFQKSCKYRRLVSFLHPSCHFDSAISSPLTRPKLRKRIRNALSRGEVISIINLGSLTVLKALNNDFSSAIYLQTHITYVNWTILAFDFPTLVSKSQKRWRKTSSKMSMFASIIQLKPTSPKKTRPDSLQ